MDISIGMTRERAREVFRRGLDIAELADDQFEYRVDGTDNSTGEPVEIVFSNDDMEDRPEMVGKVVVDADA